MNFSLRGVIVCLIWLSLSSAFELPNQPARASSKQPSPHIHTPTSKPKSQALTCPTDLETLIAEMTRDLPAYANRVSQRARVLSRSPDIYSYVIVAGRPEFTPLNLGPSEYIPPKRASTPPQQVFITTLERQYTAGKAVELEQYHWLFLTQTSSGWWLDLIFSRTGTYPATQQPQPITPPQDSSQGVVAQAVRLWLRDCREGAVPVLSPKGSHRSQR